MDKNKNLQDVYSENAMSDQLKFTDEDKEHLAWLEEQIREREKISREVERSRKKLEEAQKKREEYEKWMAEELEKVPSKEELEKSIIAILTKKDLFISLMKELEHECEKDIQRQLEVITYLNAPVQSQQKFDFFALVNMGTEEEALQGSALNWDTSIDYDEGRKKFGWYFFDEMLERNGSGIVSIFANYMGGADYDDVFEKSFDEHFSDTEFTILKSLRLFIELYSERTTNADELIENLRNYLVGEMDDSRIGVVSDLFFMCPDVVEETDINGKQCKIERKEIVQEYKRMLAFLELFYIADQCETVEQEHQSSAGIVSIETNMVTSLERTIQNDAICKPKKIVPWLFWSIDILLVVYLFIYRDKLAVEYLYRERGKEELIVLILSGIIGITIGHVITKIDMTRRGISEKIKLISRCGYTISYVLFWLLLYYSVIVSEHIYIFSEKLYEGIYEVAESITIATVVQTEMADAVYLLIIILMGISILGLAVMLLVLLLSLPKHLYIHMVIFGMVYTLVNYKIQISDLILKLTEVVVPEYFFNTALTILTCVCVMLVAIKYRKKLKADFDVCDKLMYICKEYKSKKYIISYIISALIGLIGFGTGIVLENYKPYVNFINNSLSDANGDKNMEIIAILIIGGLLYKWTCKAYTGVYVKLGIIKKNFFSLTSMLFAVSAILYSCTYPLYRYVVIPTYKMIPLIYNWIVNSESPIVQVGMGIGEIIIYIASLLFGIFLVVMLILFLIQTIMSVGINILLIPLVLGLMTVKFSLHAATLIVGYSMFTSLNLPEAIIMALSFLFSAFVQYYIMERVKKSEVLKLCILD